MIGEPFRLLRLLSQMGFTHYVCIAGPSVKFVPRGSRQAFWSFSSSPWASLLIASRSLLSPKIFKVSSHHLCQEEILSHVFQPFLSRRLYWLLSVTRKEALSRIII